MVIAHSGDRVLRWPRTAFRELIHDQSRDNWIKRQRFWGITAFGSVDACRSFAEGQVKINSAYRALF
ncbi:hypothetical protein [Streptomyces sp. NPDC059371]|uniref:hypothetical protein n=1 Tax=Streptomyces sp. NPDC059371 TaxID=3346812 RepID=UPI0036ACE13F